jgi:hypothetical protein
MKFSRTQASTGYLADAIIYYSPVIIDTSLYPLVGTHIKMYWLIFKL